MDKEGHMIVKNTIHTESQISQMRRDNWKAEGRELSGSDRLRNICGNNRCIASAHLLRLTKGHGSSGAMEDDWRWAKILILIDKHSKAEEDHVLWTGHINGPYGGASWRGRMFRAHVLSWLVAHKAQEIPEGYVIRHKCRETACISIDHLELGTRSENANDMKRDGTMLMGEKHPNAKITKEMAEQIRSSKGMGSLSKRAARFGVCIDLVSRIDHGAWSNDPHAPIQRKRKRKAFWVSQDEPKRPSQCGENNPNAKITKKIAEEIRASKGNGTIKDRAKRFGVSYGIVSEIDIGRAWSDQSIQRKRKRKSKKKIVDKSYEGLLHKIEENSEKKVVEWDELGVPKGTEHWIWKRGISHGYGGIAYGGMYIRVHRAALIATMKRPLGKNELACHLCKYTTCCNPEHLYVGDATSNATDRNNQGTMMKGENHPSHRLTSAQVIEIRERRANGEACKELAKIYGVSLSTINSIVYYRKWRHLHSNNSSPKAREIELVI